MSKIKNKLIKLLTHKERKVYTSTTENSEELFENLGFTKSYDIGYIVGYTNGIAEVEFGKDIIIISNKMDCKSLYIEPDLIYAIAKQLEEIGDNDE